VAEAASRSLMIASSVTSTTSRCGDMPADARSRASVETNSGSARSAAVTFKLNRSSANGPVHAEAIAIARARICRPNATASSAEAAVSSSVEADSRPCTG
jgi:hypothetical protein